MADQPVAWITRQTKDGKQRLEFGHVASNIEYCKVHHEWEWQPLYAAPPAALCVCGEPALGVVHRADGPCYLPEQAPPAALAVPADVARHAAAAVSYLDHSGGMHAGLSLVLQRLRDALARQPTAPAAPDCGACPGDGSMCPKVCRHAEENPPAALAVPAEPIGWVFQQEDTGRMTFCANDGINTPEVFQRLNPRHVLCGPAYTQAQQPAAAVPEVVGWLHEVVWEDGTSYWYHAREPKPLGPTPGLVSQRIGRAAMLAAARKGE